MKEIILCISAHPDDCAIGCSGTLYLHKERGDEVHKLLLSKGEKGGPPDVRIREVKASMEILGIDSIEIGNLPDTFIKDDATTISLIEKKIEELSPDGIYTPSYHELHQDHRNTSLATLSLSKKVKDILMYETPSVSPEFSPQVFSNITSSIKVKIKAMNCFTSQFNKYYTGVHSIVGLAKYRALQAGFIEHKDQYAEAFEVAKFTLR